MERMFPLNLARNATDRPPVDSPYTSRRVLSHRVEHELRTACQAILNDDGNAYGFAAAMQAQESMMNLQVDQQVMNAMRHAQQQGDHRRAGSHPQQAPARFPPSDAPPPYRLHDQYPRHPWANTNRRRQAHEQAPSSSHRADSRQHRHRPSTAPTRRGLDSSNSISSTSLSTSTMDHRRHLASTALTSAEPSRTSKRNSHRIIGEEETAPRVDTMVSCPISIIRRPSPPRSRAGSVSNSITSETKNCTCPGSSAPNRKPSRECSSNYVSTAMTSAAPATHGWRSWSLPRGPSDQSLNNNARAQERRSEIDLNRALPPLPRLDVCNDFELGTSTGTSCMPQDMSRNNYTARQHSDEACSPELHQPLTLYPTIQAPFSRGPAGSLDSVTPGFQARNDSLNRSIPSLVDSGHGWNERDLIHKPSMDMGSGQLHREPTELNDVTHSGDHRRKSRQEQRYKHMAEIQQNNTLKSEPSGSVKSLRKMLSVIRLGSRRPNRETWMDRFEKKGIRRGILVLDDTIGGTVVQY